MFVNYRRQRSVFLDVRIDWVRAILYEIVISLHYFSQRREFIIQFILLGECLDKRTQFWVVVSRHRGEQVVLYLILHTSEQIRYEEVVYIDPTRCFELISYETVIFIGLYNLFRLMTLRSDHCNKEATDKNRSNGDPPGQDE